MPGPITGSPIFSRLALKILGLVVLFGLAPLSIIVARVQLTNEDLHERVIQERLVRAAATRAGELGAWLDARHHQVAGWAAEAPLAGLLAEVSESPDAVVRLRDRLERDLGHHRAFESLFIVDMRGSVIAGTRGERLEPWAHDALGRRRPGQEPSLEGRIGYSAELGRPTLLVIEPISATEGGRAALLVGRVDLRELEHLLGPDEDDPSIQYLWVDPEGGVLAAQGRVERRPGQVQLGDLGGGDAPSPDVIELPGMEQALWGAVESPALEGSRLIATTPRSVALGGGRTLRRNLIGTSLAVILVALVALGWAARGVLRPILMLSEGARRLSAGDLQIYLPVRGRDEISALTSTFNEMTRRLREGRQDLEEARDGLARANQELRTVNQTLETLAITDGLTGLYNHRHFQDTLDKEIRRAAREQRPLSLVMLDLDHFKQFNDRWGHTEGDTALRRVATQIMRTVRSTDMAFRYGGEELAVLLPSCSKEQAAEVAEKIRLAVAAGTRRRGPGSGLTVSGGVATAPEDGQMGRGLIDAADVALYAAKARGRNCIVVAGAIPEQPTTAAG